MGDRPRRRAITIARFQAIEITLNWRWLPVLVSSSWLLAQNVLPARFPLWELSTLWLTSVAAVLAGEIALLLHELALRCLRNDVVRWWCASPGSTHRAHGPMYQRGVHTEGPIDVFLLTFVIGNVAMAAMSLVPLGGSDGARALRRTRFSAPPALERRLKNTPSVG